MYTFDSLSVAYTFDSLSVAYVYIRQPQCGLCIHSTASVWLMYTFDNLSVAYTFDSLSVAYVYIRHCLAVKQLSKRESTRCLVDTVSTLCSSRRMRSSCYAQVCACAAVAVLRYAHAQQLLCSGMRMRHCASVVMLRISSNAWSRHMGMTVT